MASREITVDLKINGLDEAIEKLREIKKLSEEIKYTTENTEQVDCNPTLKMSEEELEEFCKKCAEHLVDTLNNKV